MVLRCGACVILGLAVSRSVAAGETSTDGGGSSTSTSTSTSSSTSEGDSGVDASDSGVDTEEPCGQCGPNADGAIVFGNLGDGTPPAGETVIEVWARPKCTCFGCDCADEDVIMLRLELDGEPAGESCASSQCDFTVALTPGVHAITAIASYPSGETASSVQIEVPGDAATTETGSMPALPDDDDANGCGCVAGRREIGGLALFGALAGWRRRSRRAHATRRGEDGLLRAR